MKKNKKEIQEELEILAPSLSKMKKEATFKVPENYFNALPDQILRELNLTEEKVVVEKKSSWWTELMDRLMILMQPRIAVGLVTLALLLVSIFYLTNDENASSTNPSITEFSSAAVEDYIIENIDDFDDDLLFEIALQPEHSDDEHPDDQELNNYLDEIIDEMDDNSLEEFL